MTEWFLETDPNKCKLLPLISQPQFHFVDKFCGWVYIKLFLTSAKSLVLPPLEYLKTSSLLYCFLDLFLQDTKISNSEIVSKNMFVACNIQVLMACSLSLSLQNLSFIESSGNNVVMVSS